MKLKGFNQYANESFNKIDVERINESQEAKFQHLDEGEYGKLRSVKVTFDNGDTITTNMAAGLSDQEIKDYYKIGRQFNLGAGDGPDVMTGVANVEILESEDLEEAAERVQPMAEGYARRHPLYKKLVKFLETDMWDEIRDMARVAREYHTEYDFNMTYDEFETNPDAPQPLDFTKFRDIKTWSKEGRKYILETLDKMGEQAVDSWFKDFEHWLK